MQMDLPYRVILRPRMVESFVSIAPHVRRLCADSKRLKSRESLLVQVVQYLAAHHDRALLVTHARR